MEKTPVVICRISVQEIEQKINKHKKWLHGAKDGKRADFSNREFPPYYIFQDADLTRAIFKNIRARNALFRDCVLSHCDFRGSDLSGSGFHRVGLNFADLRSCSLTECNLAISSFWNTKVDVGVSSANMLHFEPDVDEHHIAKQLSWLLTNQWFREGFFRAEVFKS